MNSSFVSLRCEKSGFVFLLATKNPTSLVGWKIDGSDFTNLKVQAEFGDLDFFKMLNEIQNDKSIYFARPSSSNVSILKKVDDIVINILCLCETPRSDKSVDESFAIARLLESEMAAAQSKISTQSSELASLREQNQRLIDKYASVVEESAAQRDRMLGAFCRLLNSKKVRICELEAELGGHRGGVDSGDGDNGNAGEDKQEKERGSRKEEPIAASAKKKDMRGSKRKPAAAAVAAAAKPAMRRTRSGAGKVARRSSDNDED